MALNVELETDNDFECQTEDMTLNAKLKKNMMALNAELKKNNCSKHQTKYITLNVYENGGSECLKQWL